MKLICIQDTNSFVFLQNILNDFHYLFYNPPEEKEIFDLKTSIDKRFSENIFFLSCIGIKTEFDRFVFMKGLSFPHGRLPTIFFFNSSIFNTNRFLDQFLSRITWNERYARSLWIRHKKCYGENCFCDFSSGYWNTLGSLIYKTKLVVPCYLKLYFIILYL